MNLRNYHNFCWRRLYANWQWTARSSDRLTAKPMSWSIQAKQSQDETDSIPTNDGHTLRS
ncbi:hypothetical protein T08_6865 [Trichinella sp. T8]|nr:hypothetical protein T08_6865 [Trichinella sp. T8]